MIGKTYLERGRPITILATWRHRPVDMSTSDFQFVLADIGKKRSGPRNVLILREDYTFVVRPFRGLRKPKERAQ